MIGLDTVELVLEIEDKYGISIPDEDAEKLGVLGDLAMYIAEKLRSDSREAEYEKTLRELISILIKNYGVPEGRANSQSHIVHDLWLD